MAFKKSCDDIIGKIYGSIKILREVEPRSTNYAPTISQVECECLICGIKFVKDASKVRSGRVKGHRGCSPSKYRHPDMTKDITNQMYGNWKILKEYRGGSNCNTRMCLCECQCEYKTIWRHRKYDLLLGRTLGCKYCKPKRAGETNKSPNKYDLTHDYGIGYTDKGEKFYFDLEDYDLIKGYHWYLDQTGYIHSQYKDEYGKIRHIKMHRLVMNVSNPKIVIDHIGHNTVDNRKAMLRICSIKENVINRQTNKNKIGIKGVKKDGNNWTAYIGFNYERIYLGSYRNKEDAIAARKAAEEKYFGEYSYDASMKKAERYKIKE